MSERPKVAYKVLTAEQMEALSRDGSFAGAPVDLADGYVHMSCLEQLTETVDRHFAGQRDLYVVAVELDALGPDLRWERSRGGALFPHLYAPLTLAAVIAQGRLERGSTGEVKAPDRAAAQSSPSTTCTAASSAEAPAPSIPTSSA